MGTELEKLERLITLLPDGEKRRAYEARLNKARSHTDVAPQPGTVDGALAPVMWETGDIAQIRSLLVLREAELVAAEAQLTGDPVEDWCARNRIGFLKPIVADLKKWLAEAMEKKSGQ